MTALFSSGCARRRTSAPNYGASLRADWPPGGFHPPPPPRNSEAPSRIRLGPPASLYVNLGPVVSSVSGLKTTEQTCDFIDRLYAKVMEGVVERACSDFALHTNAVAPKLRMKREVIADRAI